MPAAEAAKPSSERDWRTIILTPALDFLTALELSPAELVEQAARNDCRTIGLLVQPFRQFPFPDGNLIGDTAERRKLRQTCRDLDVKIDTIEVFILDQGCKPELFRPAIETGAYLGASAVNTLAFDRDEARLAETYGEFCEIASQCGLSVLSEVIRTLPHNSITTAVAFFDKFELDVKIELDSLHFFRYGGEFEEIVRHRDKIGRAQLCDGPSFANDAQYLMEALYNRQIPGKGDLSLIKFLAALPSDIVVGLEVPHPEFRTAERISRVLASYHELMAQVTPY
jgi:sugar phosphate isomerase/epimerase